MLRIQDGINNFFAFKYSTRKSIAIAGILFPFAFTSLLVGKWPYVLNVDFRFKIKCYSVNHGVLFAKAEKGIEGQVSTGFNK